MQPDDPEDSVCLCIDHNHTVVTGGEVELIIPRMNAQMIAGDHRVDLLDRLFVVVRDSEVKSGIREAAEEEELDFYQNRAPPGWLEALAHLDTDEHKTFLEEAPVLIAISAESYELHEGEKVKNYYVTESVGIATGLLITGLHRAGLATLTHTPSPVGFLNEILRRPENERPFLLLVPDITSKPLNIHRVTHCGASCYL